MRILRRISVTGGGGSSQVSFAKMNEYAKGFHDADDEEIACTDENRFERHILDMTSNAMLGRNKLRKFRL